MKKRVLILLIVAFAIFSASAQELKIGSLAPRNTPYDDILRQLGDEWRSISNGRIRMTIYPGGTAGDEPDMIRKVRIGTLQGAVLSGIGLSRISSDALVLTLPFFFDGIDEVDYVLEKMTPTIEAKLEDKGFVVIALVAAGWINFFSRDPVMLPDDMKTQKMVVTNENSELEQVWKSLGFDIVNISSDNIISSIQAGRIDALYSPPVLAASYQWFTMIDNMLAPRLSPLIGSLVLSKSAWRRIPNNMKAELLASAQDLMVGLYSQTQELDERAMNVMLDYGLNVTEISDEDYLVWEQMFRQGTMEVVGPNRYISTEVFEEAVGYLNEYREN